MKELRVLVYSLANVLTRPQTYDFLDINEFKLFRRHVKELKEIHFLIPI
jgi:hypothetical protein